MKALSRILFMEGHSHDFQLQQVLLLTFLLLAGCISFGETYPFEVTANDLELMSIKYATRLQLEVIKTLLEEPGDYSGVLTDAGEVTGQVAYMISLSVQENLFDPQMSSKKSKS